MTRYVFVHAHPDDETLSSGAILLALAHRGDACFVLTATRGERGEVVAGPLSRLEGTPELRAHRERELSRALGELDVRGHAMLGTPPARATGLPPRDYVDSGMRWLTPTVAGPGDDAGADALTAAQLSEVTADIAAYATAVRAAVLVSYDATGGYGHPDHVRLHEATRLAAADLRLRWAVIAPPEPAEISEADGRLRIEQFVAPDRKSLLRALRAHASQFTTYDDHVVHSGGQTDPIAYGGALIEPIS